MTCSAIGGKRQTILSLGVLLLLLTISCKSDEEPIRASRAAITDGVLHTGHPAVGALLLGNAPFCTATLVGRQHVITAAHCVSGEAPGTENPSNIAFHIGVDTEKRLMGDAHAIDAIFIHPSFELTASAQPGQFGDVCTIGSDNCATGLTCIPSARMWTGICSKPCTNVGYDCSGSPAGTRSSCVLKHEESYDCYFVCGLGSTTYDCPSSQICDQADNPPGSEQYWCGNPFAVDVALLRLAQRLTEVPIPIGQQAPTPGTQLSLLGYGIIGKDEEGSPLGIAGVKRLATNKIKYVYDAAFTFEGSGGEIGSTCHGDSGGPSLATYKGQELLIGVHSTGNCDPSTELVFGGADIRTDQVVSWLNDVAPGEVLFERASADTSPPTLSVLNLVDGDTVDASFTVDVEASDNVGVYYVEVTGDGVGSPVDWSPPYTFDVTLSPGVETQLVAKAFDAAGNTSSASITVTTKPNPPSGSPPVADNPTTSNNDPSLLPSDVAPEGGAPDNEAKQISIEGSCSLGGDRDAPGVGVLTLLLLVLARRRRAS